MGKLINEINGSSGYSTQIKLSQSDLETLRQMIHAQWLYRLQIDVPQHIRKFDEYGIEQYHQLSHLIDHTKMWSKNTRIFPKEANQVIKNLHFYKKLENEFGKFLVADEEQLGWENFYWRLVRPGVDDYGSIHADQWFWKLGINGAMPLIPHQRLKIWIAIYTTPGKNGLMIMPGSHNKQDWKWHAEERFGRLKPVIDEPEENLNMTLLPLAASETVVFHDGLLHGGAPNLADTTRISLEFTILVPEKNMSLSNDGSHHFEKMV